MLCELSKELDARVLQIPTSGVAQTFDGAAGRCGELSARRMPGRKYLMTLFVVELSQKDAACKGSAYVITDGQTSAMKLQQKVIRDSIGGDAT